MSRIENKPPVTAKSPPTDPPGTVKPLPPRPPAELKVDKHRDISAGLKAHTERIQQSQYIDPELRKPLSEKEAKKAAKRENRSEDMKDLHDFLVGLPWKNQGFTEDEIGDFVPFPGQDPILGGEGVLPEQIMQGISNCYWAAALKAVLRRDPQFVNDKVRQLSPTEVANWRDKETGKQLDPTKNWYEATLYPRGMLGLREKTVTVLVNDELPRDSRRLHLASGETLTQDIQKTFLYEKAFAQWSGGYDELAWGNAGKALANMTGESTTYTLFPMVKDNALFRKIQRRAENGEAMVVVAFDLADYLESSDIGEKEGKEKEGKKSGRKEKKTLAERVEKYHTGEAASRNRIVDQHCYAVVGAKKVEDPNNPGKQKKVVVIQDPRRGQPFEMDLAEFKKSFLFMATNPLQARNFDDLYADVSAHEAARNDFNVGRYRTVLA